MINQINLHNFQSHKETDLVLSPGINAVVGPSDSGKSAILRALYWAINNRPSGDSFVSHWARDEKGKQTQAAYVVILKGDHALMRLRSKDKNGYKLDDKIEFEAIRTDVPEEVQDFFNLSEVNIQKQMDSPFLLSESAGEVARFFNKTIKLDTIDTTLSLVDKKKRECDQQIKVQETILVERREALKAYAWIDDAKVLVDRLEKIRDKKSGIVKQWDDLKQLQIQWEYSRDQIRTLDKLLKAEPVLKEIHELNIQAVELNKESSSLEQGMEDYIELFEQVNEANSYLNCEQSVERILKINEKTDQIRVELGEIGSSLTVFNGIKAKIPIIEQGLKGYLDQMPDVCPLCNGTGRLK